PTLDRAGGGRRTVGDGGVLLDRDEVGWRRREDLVAVVARGLVAGARGQRRENTDEACRESRTPHAGPSVLTRSAAAAGSVGPAPYDGHQRATGHTPQAGFLAWHMRRPCQIRW